MQRDTFSKQLLLSIQNLIQTENRILSDIE